MTVIKLLMLAAALLVIPSPGLAQTTIAFDEFWIGPGGTMKVSLSVPEASPLAKPRFHVIRDGDKTPGARSRGWVDFPEMAGTQDVTLRAPAAEGEFWLILNDGSRMVAREPFSVMSWDAVREWTMRRLERKAEELRESLAKEPGGVSPQPEATTQAVRLLTSPPETRPGATLDVTIRLPADVTEPLDLQVAWATTASLGYVEKERDATARRVGSPIAVRASGKQPSTVSIPAPAQPGEYDVLLMLGSGLLDAATVTVR